MDKRHNVYYRTPNILLTPFCVNSFWSFPHHLAPQPESYAIYCVGLIPVSVILEMSLCRAPDVVLSSFHPRVPEQVVEGLY